MSENRSARWFSDDGPGLDRFGAVLGLSVLSVAVLSLIDLDGATSGIRSEFGLVIVSVTVAATLIAALRASGVAKRPRRVVEILLVVGVGIVIIFLVVERTIGGDTTRGLEPAQPPILWSLIAAISPIVVLRRVMKHDTVALATLLGALAAYLLVALAFNFAFLSVESVGGGVPFFGEPESTSSFMYFSLSTITTVGYGDLSAIGDVGRFLSSAEAVIGQVLLVTVVARLVSLYSRVPAASLPPEGQSVSVPVE